MFDVLFVALSGDQMSLGSHISFCFFLLDPPLFEHGLLLGNLGEFGFSGHLTGVILPVEDGHSLLDGLLLLSGFEDFSFSLFLLFEFPQLGVDHFLGQVFLELFPLVDELFLTFNLSTSSIEFLIFLTKLISRTLELLIHPAGDLLHPLNFSLILKISHSLKHLFAHLFRCLHSSFKLTLIVSFFLSEHRGEFDFALFEVSSLSSFEICESGAY